MMEIKYGVPPISLSRELFNKLDYRIMGVAFNLHNEMGNLWDESEYRHELAQCCTELGLDAHEEVAISLSRNGFSKKYFIDLLINGGVYELKTTSGITAGNEAQTLNYLFLTNTRHGKTINFRQDSLTWRFVSTTLTTKQRKEFSIKTSEWNPTEKQGQDLLTCTHELLQDWGAYLSINLYKEALCFHMGTPIENDKQRFIPISNNVLLYVSGLSAGQDTLRNNLQKYLKRSNFSELFWINFNQNSAELSSLNHSA